MKYNLFLFSIISLLLSSCAQTQYMLRSEKNPSEIKKILVLQPCIKIDLISKGNKGEYNNNLSQQIAADILEVIDRSMPSKIEKTRLDADSIELVEIYKEIYALADQVEKERKITGIKLSKNILTLLDKHNQDYAVGVLNFGFTRVEGNYRKQVNKGLAIGLAVGLLTLGNGFITTIPIKSHSTVICFIIDKASKNIAFYRKNVGQEVDPANKLEIQMQITSMLIEYFKSNNMVIKK